MTIEEQIAGLKSTADYTEANHFGTQAYTVADIRSIADTLTALNELYKTACDCKEVGFNARQVSSQKFSSELLFEAIAAVKALEDRE